MSEGEFRAGASVLLSRIEKRFGERVVLKGVELDVGQGEFVTVVGRSGSGKSTLLRLLCGLETPTSGSVRIVDDRGADGTNRVRVVFQEPRLLPWKSVLHNVCIGLPRATGPRAREVLGAVGLADRAAEYPGVLSGGQLQRVALARALVNEPLLLLLDEPFGALDALTRIEAQRLVESLWLRRHFTAVLVTHDVGEAVLLGDRVLVVDDGCIAARFDVNVPRPRRRGHPDVERIASEVLERIFATNNASANERNADDLPDDRAVATATRRTGPTVRRQSYLHGPGDLRGRADEDLAPLVAARRARK